MTSATEVLRRMLDERGIEWGNVRNDGYESDHLTKWQINGIQGHAFITVTEWPGGLTLETFQRCPTPEQAIAATLGNGTCENISDPPEGFYCSSCGWGDFAEPSHLLTKSKFTDNDGGPNYCPNCGKKVKR